MTANPRKAGLIIVATIGDFPVTVHVTLTSTVMKDEQNLDDEGRESEYILLMICIKTFTICFSATDECSK